MKDQPNDNASRPNAQGRKKQNADHARTDDGSIFERVVPDGIRRGLEHLLKEGRLKHVLGEIKMPKEIIPHIISQVDDTKKAAIQVISREVRLFLENTNLADELAKLLTQISFQVKTEVRFVPNDKAIAKKNAKPKEGSESTKEPESPGEQEQASDKNGQKESSE